VPSEGVRLLFWTACAYVLCCEEEVLVLCAFVVRLDVVEMELLLLMVEGVWYVKVCEEDEKDDGVLLIEVADSVEKCLFPPISGRRTVITR
jgi:hypothetical protein